MLTAPELRHNSNKKRQDIYNAHPKNNLTIVLDKVYDVANVGLIFRMADALNAKEVILCGEQCELPNNKRIRASSVKLSDVVNWSYYVHTQDALKSLKTQGTFIVGCELTPDAIDYRKANFGALKTGIAMIMGNESHGIQPEVLNMCDIVVKMPQHGINTSMNVGVAMSILGYKILESLENT